MTPEIIVGAAGAAIALIFGYFPVLRTKYAGLATETKSLTMIGLMVLTGFAVWGLGCIGWYDSGIACTTNQIPEVIKLVVLAIIANQSVNRIFPETKDVKQARALR